MATAPFEMGAPEHEALLERALRADPAALGRLYDQYVDGIYQYIYRRVGSADLAEDLTHQAFLRMLEAVRQGRPWRTSFSGWLYRIAHNLVVDHYRRNPHIRCIALSDSLEASAMFSDPAATAQARHEAERLMQALGCLTHEQVEVITLRFLEEMSVAEVAGIMNRSDCAIKSMQHRAVLSLRRAMLA